MPRRTSYTVKGFAGDTDVPVERSKAQIETLLSKHGAEGYQTGWQLATDNAPGWDVVGFMWKNKQIRFRVERAPKGEASNRLIEQQARQRWRLLLLVIKAKLEAVEAGVAIFEEEFMAHIVTENGKTVGELVLPRILGAVNGKFRLEVGRGE